MLLATQEGKLEKFFDWEFEFFLIITFKGFRTYPKICMAVLNSDPDFLKDLMAVPWLGSARLLCLVTILSIESLLNRNSYPFWAAHVLSTRDSSACWKKMFLKEPHTIIITCGTRLNSNTNSLPKLVGVRCLLYFWIDSLSQDRISISNSTY